MNGLNHQKRTADTEIMSDCSSAVYLLMENNFEKSFQLAYSQEGETRRIEINLLLPKGTKKIRLNPAEGSACIIRELKVWVNNEIQPPFCINGYEFEGLYFFEHKNPQITYEGKDTGGKMLHIEAEVYLFGENGLGILLKKLGELNSKNQEQRRQMDRLNAELVESQNSYWKVTHSDIWKITKPYRIFTDWVKNRLRSYNATRFLLAGAMSIKNTGIKATWKKVKTRYLNKRYHAWSKTALQALYQTGEKLIVLNNAECGTITEIPQGDRKIAVQVHLFRTDGLEAFIKTINRIPYAYDCYISTDQAESIPEITEVFGKGSNADRVYVEKYPIEGRDIKSFLRQMKDRAEKYDYICHIHNQRPETEYGVTWNNYMIRNIIGSEAYIRSIFRLFEEKPELGMLFPENYPLIPYYPHWKSSRQDRNNGMGITGGNTHWAETMFWARTKAVGSLIEQPDSDGVLPARAAGEDRMSGHWREQLCPNEIKLRNYDVQKVFNNCRSLSGYSDKKRIIFYVHYDKCNVISETDISYLKQLNEFISSIIFITNSPLSEQELAKVRPLVRMIIRRENKGYDFGAWKEGLLAYGFDNLLSFDEVILTNNSCMAPVFPLYDMFNTMEQENVDFWGVTVHPFRDIGEFIGKSYIKQHLQSYFQVFHRKAFAHEVFREYWITVQEFENWAEAVAEGETEMTEKLANAGLNYSYYIKESLFLPTYLHNHSLMYEFPTIFLLLGCPFVKKKAYGIMDPEEEQRLELLLKNLKNE